MPFSAFFGPRANLAILLVMFVLVLSFTCTFIGLAHAYGGADPRSLELYKLVGICGIFLGVIVLLIRSQATDKKVDATSQKVDATDRKMDATTQYIHDTSHSLHGSMNKTASLVQAATKEMTNGGLKAAVSAVVREEALPEVIRSPEFRQVVTEIVSATAAPVAEATARRVCDELAKGPRPDVTGNSQ